MNVEISIGEAIDKLSILEIKYLKITDEQKRTEIQKEIDGLSECLKYKQQHEFYYNILVYINEQIWMMNDNINNLSQDNSTFLQISNQIFLFNKKRFRLKNWFNILTSSNIKEHTNYATTHCQIEVCDEETFLEKLPEIHLLAIKYDVITFNGQFIPNRDFLNIPTVIYDDFHKQHLPPPTTINLNNYLLPQNISRNVFEYNPIVYLIGGKFGDFINLLSVVCEKYYETGKKGILYISEHVTDKLDQFEFGLENTYKDLYPVIINQPYIKDFKILTEVCTTYFIFINLTDWRLNRNLFVQNLYDTFKQTYNIEWGKHKWLTCSYDDKWKNKVVINMNDRRFVNIDFELLKQKYPNELIFISADKYQHEYFEKTLNCSVEYYEWNNFSELSTIINSCKLFIGCMSGPFCIANAVHKHTIGYMPENNEDPLRQMTYGLDLYFPNLTFSGPHY